MSDQQKRKQRHLWGGIALIALGVLGAILATPWLGLLVLGGIWELVVALRTS